MLVLTDVSFSLASGQSIVEDVELSLRTKEIVGIVGPSGVGKSTVFRLVAGLLTPSSGLIKLEGFDLASLPVAQRPISFLQQSFPLYHHLTVLENVLVPIEQSGDGDVDRNELKAQNMLTKLRISDQYWDRRPTTLSGGEAQRVALAKTLLKPARLLLLDEPFSNIDKNLRLQINQVIRDQVNARDQGALIISHDENDLIFSADRVAIMKLRRIVQVGAPEDLITEPVAADSAAFGASLGLQRVDTEQLNTGQVVLDSSFQIPDDANRLGWRPTSGHVQRTEEIDSTDKESLRIRGEIGRRINLGDDTYMTVVAPELTPSEQLWLGSSIQDLPKGLKAGDSVCLCISVDQLYLLDRSDNVISSDLTAS